MISQDKREFGGWWIWVLFLVMITIGIFAVFKPAGMWWEREVMLESHQYKEARATEMATFKAQLVAVDMMLATESDPTVRADLKRQKMMLTQQMSISRTRAGQEGIITKTINNL